MTRTRTRARRLLAALVATGALVATIALGVAPIAVADTLGGGSPHPATSDGAQLAPVAGTVTGDPVGGGPDPTADSAVRLLTGPGIVSEVGGATDLAAPAAVSCAGPGGTAYTVEVQATEGTGSQRQAQAEAAAGSFPFQSELASYLSSRSGSVTVAAQTRGGEVFVYTKGESTNVTASIVKVQVMATVMRRAQEAGRGLSAWEKSKIVPMIHTSDNAATTALWDYVGRGPEVLRVDRLMGLSSTRMSSTGSWGLTVTTAADNVTLMNHFAYANPVLSDSNRAYGMALMDDITPSQDWGVSSGPPAGTVQLKNGWLPRTDGWHVNSIGFSSSGPTPYSIAVLTHSTTASMDTQVATIQGVSRIVWRHAGSLRGAVRGDWGGDKHADVLGRTDAGKLAVYPGVGAGKLLAAGVVNSGWGSMTWLGSPGDIDRDGHTDLLAVDQGGALLLFRGLGTSRWAAPRVINHGWATLTAIATPGDFDGNGTADLLGRSSDGRLAHYSISTSGVVTRVGTVGAGWNTVKTIIGCDDLTADGRGDVMAVTTAGHLAVYLSTGRGFTKTSYDNAGWNGVGLVSSPGDLTGDGLADLAGTSSDTVVVYPGRKGGGVGSRIATGQSSSGMVGLY
jgi:beta-lactamase class A